MLLGVIATVLIVEMQSLLIGEGATAVEEAAILQALVGGAIVRVIHCKTQYLGPDELMVAAKVAVPGQVATILYIDAVVSPADTGLIYTTVTARISYAMARNDNAPKKLGEVTARGVPLASVALAFVIGLIVFLPFPGWQKLVGFITSATVLSFGSGRWSCRRCVGHCRRRTDRSGFPAAMCCHSLPSGPRTRSCSGPAGT